MPNVFTIFCHGTGFNRDKGKEEIVNFFGHTTPGKEYEDWLMLDGVGSKAGDGTLAGQYDWASKNREKKKNRKFSEWFEASETIAQATGHGVSDNVRHAIVVLANLDPQPTRVNLIGWSRGAVTALIIANRITEILPGIADINIFAVDPVAGKEAGLDPNKPENRTIPGSVKNYIAILATGENRQTFKPQDAARVIVKDAKSNVVFLPMPGKHATPAVHDAKTIEVTHIVWSMAYRFLRKFGTPVQKTPLGYLDTDLGMLETYSEIKLKEDIYKKVKQKGAMQMIIGKGLAPRDFAKHLDDYVVAPEYFINQHHRKCFKACLPETFKWLFSKHAQQANKDQIRQEVSGAPETLKSLAVVGVSLEGPTLNLPDEGLLYDPTRPKNIKFRGSLHDMGILLAKDVNKNDE